jgi:hypothetical protein
MWPRLLAQLIELTPHVTRLVPLADNYFATRANGDRAHAAALNTLSDTMRSDLATISDSTTALSVRVNQQLADQTARITSMQRALEQAEADNITQNRQLEWLTRDVNSLRIWVKFGTATIILLLAVTLGLLVKLFLSR